jgi:cholesterol oxidase
MVKSACGNARNVIPRRTAIQVLTGLPLLTHAAPLSSPWSRRKPTYDFVVIGSGYGGSVVAARLASANLRPKPSICVLERGKEWSPGAFPDNLPGLYREMRSAANPTGLFNLSAYGPVSILQASGVGGGSLIDGGVASVPEPAVWAHAAWPRALRNDHESGRLGMFYERARAVLGSAPYPPAASEGRGRALARSFSQSGKDGRFAPAALNINWTVDGSNAHGAPMKPCIACGDCMTGCNAGAKNSLDRNYLRIAAMKGAEVYGSIRVDWIELLPGTGFRIHLRNLENRNASKPETLNAANIVLAAGCPGSAEILLRSEAQSQSRANKLSISRQTGARFGGNGEATLVAYNTEHRTDVIGWGVRRSNAASERLGIVMPGPAVVGRVQGGLNLPFGRHVVVEDMSCPTAMAGALRTALSAMRSEAPVKGEAPANEERKRSRILIDLNPSRSRFDEGALNYSMLFRGTGIEEPAGRFALQKTAFDPDGRLVLAAPPTRDAVIEAVQNYLRQGAEALGAGGMFSNIFGILFNVRAPVLTQPLGGCPMGETVDKGAVNHRGEVFDRGGEILKGLYVVDASTIPAPLGTGPLLTVAALAERAAALLISRLDGGAP